MSRQQKKVLLILTGIGLLFFSAFFFPNATGAKDEYMLYRLSADESVTYPVVIRMLTPDPQGVETAWFRWIIYGDYHYGYPFYLISALVLLPVRIIMGASFVDYTQLNLLLLRQFVSVLPMVVAAGMMVYLQTRFRSTLIAVLLFVFMLAVPGFVRNHLSWWHPDAFSVLFVVLVIFFLDRDRLRFGRNFYLAALACGLASAIKLSGIFFFLTIPAYLLAGFILEKINLRNTITNGFLFVLVMGLTIILSNPFLFYSGARQRMLEIQAQKSYEISHGYVHEQSVEYNKGPRYWEPTLSRWYGVPVFLFFMAASLLWGSKHGPEQFVNRVLFTWFLPFTIYLLFFVSVKPDHYWLPVMLPLFSCVFIIPAEIWTFVQKQKVQNPSGLARWLGLGLFACLVILLSVIFITNLGYDISLFQSFLEQEKELGLHWWVEIRVIAAGKSPVI